MGNSVSACDYTADLLQGLDKPEYFVTDEADEELGLSQTFRSSHNGTDPKTPLITGLPWKKGDYSKTTHSIWNGFKIGQSEAGGDYPCLGQRCFRVPDEPYQHSPEKLATLGAKYIQTGYVEKKDGNVDRFEYKYATFNETEKISIDFARGIVGGLGMKPFESRLSVFLPNRPEFYFAAFGCWSQGMPLIPLYTTLGPDSIETIFEDTLPETMLATKENVNVVGATLKKMIESGKSHPLKTVIICDTLLDNRWGNIYDQVDPKLAEKWEKDYGVKIIPFSTILSIGQKVENQNINPLSDEEIKPDTLAFIMFTSGTTSETNRVKGVRLTHGGFLSCVGASRFIIDVPKHESIFSFLPLSHVFQICLDLAVLFAGARIDFGSGDIRNLASDLVEAQPYCLPVVPRIVTRFYQGVFDKINQEGFLKRWYIYRSYNHQADGVRTSADLDDGYDERVFKVIRTKMGLGNCKLMIVSAAPCPPQVLEFMRILLGPAGSCLLSYGLTESHAGLSTSRPGDLTLGHIGTPLTSCEFRLKNVEDMEMRYTDEEPRGELLVRGNSITPGYFMNDEENDKAFLTDKNGLKWYQTGDIVQMHKKSGVLRIIDRRKNCLKLGQGEYVSVEKLISIYGQSPLLSQIFPYGNSFKYSMVGVVVPNILELHKFAVSKGWWKLDSSPVIGDLSPEIVDALQKIGIEHQKELVEWLHPSMVQYEGGMSSFEKIKAFHVDTHYQDDLGLVFCEANNLLTATMKLKFKFLAKHYHLTLEKLYDSIGEPTPPGQPWW